MLKLAAKIMTTERTPKALGRNGILACLYCFAAASCTVAPGGGGCTQIAPDFIRAAEGGTVRLELAVWGSGGEIAGRYTDIGLSYRLVGEQEYKSASIRVVSSDAKHQAIEAQIPPVGREGEIEYFVELKLDGHYSRVDGIKKIRVVS